MFLSRKNTHQAQYKGCLDVTSNHVLSTVTFRPTWNIHCDTLTYCYVLTHSQRPLYFLSTQSLFGLIVMHDITSTPFTWNWTFYPLLQFVHPWEISCLFYNLFLCDISPLCDIVMMYFLPLQADFWSLKGLSHEIFYYYFARQTEHKSTNPQIRMLVALT